MEINELPTIDTSLPANPVNIKDIVGYIINHNNVPTYKPNNFWSSLRIYNGKLYFYDFDNNTWYDAGTGQQAGEIKLVLPTEDAKVVGNVTESFAAGETIAAGKLVFLNSSSKWMLVDADSVSTCNGMLAISMEAKTDTQTMKVALQGSMIRFDAWNWTPGATLYASETAGGIATAIPTGADNVIKVIGFALDADSIYFNPSPDQQTTVA